MTISFIKMRLMRKYCLFLLLFCLLPLASGAQTAAPEATKADINTNTSALLADISAYLQAFDNVSGRFIQINPQGDTLEGRFLFKQPGFLRFSYDAPSQLLIVANGRRLFVQEMPDESPATYPLDSTPLPLFLGKNTNLQRTGYVKNIVQSADFVELQLEDPSGDIVGQVYLGFNYPNIRLRNWRVVDAQDQIVSVFLRDIVMQDNIDMGLFEVETKRSIGPNRRKSRLRKR